MMAAKVWELHLNQYKESAFLVYGLPTQMYLPVFKGIWDSWYLGSVDEG